MTLFNWYFTNLTNKKLLNQNSCLKVGKQKAKRYDNVIKAQNAMTRYIQRG